MEIRRRTLERLAPLPRMDEVTDAGDVRDAQVAERRDLSESSMALLTKATKEVAPAQLMPA